MSNAPLSIQNCYGESVKVIIEADEQFDFDQSLVEHFQGNEIVIELKYPDSQKIGKANMKEIKSGLPFEKMTIIRARDTTIMYRGDDIIPMMDLDVIAQIAVPFSICL